MQVLLQVVTAMDFFEITAIPNRDVWVCTRCGEHGIMGVGRFMGSSDLSGQRASRG